MSEPIPYLGFKGNCAEALRFYATAVGGKIEILMTGADSPAAAQFPGEHADRMGHARLALRGGGYLNGGDTLEEAQSAFDKLCTGGKATMPMAPSFWARRFGMLTDRFGRPRLINGGMLIQC